MNMDVKLVSAASADGVSVLWTEAEHELRFAQARASACRLLWHLLEDHYLSPKEAAESLAQVAEGYRLNTSDLEAHLLETPF